MLGDLLSSISGLFKQPRTTAAPLAGIAASDGIAAKMATGHAGAQQLPTAPEVARVQSLIGQVRELTSTVAKDVGDHRVNVQEISNELTLVARTDTDAVAEIVCKLVMANQELQGRLERAESTLQAHSRQLHDAVVSARTDGLTGLLNRRALDEELRRCLVDLQGQGQPAALLMVDVDHFKRFNDTFGHVAGDQALIQVAETLKTGSRAADTVARYGGEEFAVVFVASSATAVRERAEGLRQAIGRRSLDCDGREVQVTASAGLAEASTDDTVADWVKRADTALYAAKKAGRNCAFQAISDTVEPLTSALKEESQLSAMPSTGGRTLTEAAAELAPDAFADAGFVQIISKRIAEWRRGGATLTVILARLDQPLSADDVSEDHISRRPMRLAMQLARACLREMDVLTRWGREGLAILLPSTSAADAKTVARRLRSSLATHGATDECGEPPASVGIGIAEGIEGNDAKRVLERAWVALEAARATGAGNISVHDGLKVVNVKIMAAAR